jgi:hypothetical protein
MTAKGPASASRAHQTAWPVPQGRSLPAGTSNPGGRSSVAWNTVRTAIALAYFAVTADAKASSNSRRITKTASPKPARTASWTA